MNFLYKMRTHRNMPDHDIDQVDIDAAQSVVFCVISRFGDSVIACKVIQEFIDLYPGKKFSLITTAHFLPYAQKIFEQKDIQILVFNKHNPIYLFNLLRIMNFDIGFNPHSFGAETDFIISLCVKYSFFKLHHRENLGLNYYDMTRDYLGLPRKAARLRKESVGKDYLNPAEDILICPESTEARRTLDDAQVLAIVEQLQKEGSKKITVAIASPEKYPRILLQENISLFKLKKSKKSSRQFIKRIIESDLGICVDSAPLHLFNIFGKSNIALLSSVPPETVLDFDTQSAVIRSLNMKGVYCELTQCRQPACMNNLSQLMFNQSYNYPFVDNSEIRVEYTRCVEL